MLHNLSYLKYVVVFVEHYRAFNQNINNNKSSVEALTNLLGIMNKS